MNEFLNALRDLDKRQLTSEAELTELAKQYNVKARVWHAGIVLRAIDKKVYQHIRDAAVEQIMLKGGGTADALCREIERLIDEGHCGLGKKTYLPKNRKNFSRMMGGRAGGVER